MAERSDATDPTLHVSIRENDPMTPQAMLCGIALLCHRHPPGFYHDLRISFRINEPSEFSLLEAETHSFSG